MKNLARPGARVIESRAIAENITPEDHIVLVEIGGNDLLSGTASVELERSLELLLSKLSVHGRAIVMFGLPRLPNRIAYGRIQRRLASKYSIWLVQNDISSWCLVVFGGANATFDGLHLSPSGIRQMALLVARVLSPILKSSSLCLTLISPTVSSTRR
jgi:lysophospholipase L1-like esterase